jgi:AcrR family transcriptional regulator
MPPSFDEYRLPRGRHGIPREQVQASQRWRLLGGCAEVLSERGYAATTVAAVTSEAAVSKKTFYQHFDGLASCILATYELTTETILGLLGDVCRTSPGEASQLTEAMRRLLEFLVAEPALGYVLTDGALDDVPGLAAARAEFTERCASLLASARGEPEGASGGNYRARHLAAGLQGWLSLQVRRESSPAAPQELSCLLVL